MRALITTCLLVVVAGIPVAAQDEALSEAADQARKSFQRHDTGALLAPAIRGIRLQLPGAEPSAPVSQAQGAALLKEYLSGAEEVGTTVRAARVVASGRGYVELVRNYRVAGTSETRRQSVLLGYRLEGERWVLSELRITRN